MVQKINVSSLAFEARKNEEGPLVYSHVPKNSEQYKDLVRTETATILFNGANGYISPLWYEHISAPTWDFETIRVDGEPEILSEDSLIDHLDQLIRLNEEDGSSFSFESLESSYLQRLLPKIAGFKVTLDKVHIRRKLSQDKSQDEAREIHRGLQARNRPLDSWLGDLILRANDL